MAQLPPKVPSIAQNWPAPNFSHHHHQNLEEALAINHNPSWLDEFLDFSSSKRGSHKRSMSDSIAFLEAPIVAECRRSTTTFVPGGGGDGNNNNSNNNNNNNNIGELFERFDDEQLMSMFAEDHVNVSFSNPSSPSDDNSINDVDEIKQLGGTCDHLQQMQLKSEPHEEDASSCKSEGLHGNGITSDNSSNDKIFDPKRVKRILANRQSAQRSRVRKLQYISELERSVSSLQAEVSVLSPRVAFLDHQRLVLNVDNTILKQRIAALAQDKLFKDAHQEALKKEIERLRKIYYQRNLKKMETGNCSTHEKEQLAVN